MEGNAWPEIIRKSNLLCGNSFELMGNSYSKKKIEASFHFLLFQFYLGYYDPDSIVSIFPHDIFITIFSFQVNYWKDCTPDMVELKERSLYARKIKGVLKNILQFFYSDRRNRLELCFDMFSPKSRYVYRSTRFTWYAARN